METTFRWRSWLGASVIVFLIFGVINVGLAVAVPATLHLNGSFLDVGFGAGDAQLLGRSFAGLRQRPDHRRNGMRMHHWERHQASSQSVRVRL
jgi:hypothetical protein